MTQKNMQELFELIVSKSTLMPRRHSSLQAFFEMILRNPPIESPDLLAAEPI
jgi:hypothetical protein